MNNKLYIDSCCLIDGLKSIANLQPDHPDEIYTIKQILRAAKHGAIDLFTSYVTVSEITYIDENDRPPNEETKKLIERLLLSGKDGIKIVSLTPKIALEARDIAWEHNVYSRTTDLIHVASAIRCGAQELLTLDGRLSRLKRKSESSSISQCRIISPNETQLLPNEYRTGNMFEGEEG